MMNQILRVVFVLSIAMNLGVLGMAAYQRYGGGPAPGIAPGAGVSLRDELSLTGDQARAFADLHEALQVRVQPMREQMRQRRQGLFELLAGTLPDPDAIDGALAEISRVQFDVQHAVADYVIAQMRLLTPEQRVAFVQVLVRRSCEQGPSLQGQPAHLPLIGPLGARPQDEPR